MTIHSPSCPLFPPSLCNYFPCRGAQKLRTFCLFHLISPSKGSPSCKACSEGREQNPFPLCYQGGVSHPLSPLLSPKQTLLSPYLRPVAIPWAFVVLPTLSIVLSARQKLTSFHLPPLPPRIPIPHCWGFSTGRTPGTNLSQALMNSPESQKVFHRSQAEAAQDQHTWWVFCAHKSCLRLKLFLFCVLWNRTGAALSQEYHSPWRPLQCNDSTASSRDWAMEKTGKSGKRALHARVK